MNYITFIKTSHISIEASLGWARDTKGNVFLRGTRTAHVEVLGRISHTSRLRNTLAASDRFWVFLISQNFSLAAISQPLFRKYWKSGALVCKTLRIVSASLLTLTVFNTFRFCSCAWYSSKSSRSSSENIFSLVISDATTTGHMELSESTHVRTTETLKGRKWLWKICLTYHLSYILYLPNKRQATWSWCAIMEYHFSSLYKDTNVHQWRVYHI